MGNVGSSDDNDDPYQSHAPQLATAVNSEDDVSGLTHAAALPFASSLAVASSSFSSSSRPVAAAGGSNESHRRHPNANVDAILDGATPSADAGP